MFVCVRKYCIFAGWNGGINIKTKIMMGDLFNKYLLKDFVNAYKKALIEEIDKLEITESFDINSIVDRLEKKYYIEPIVIGNPKPSEPKETTRQFNQWGNTNKQKIFEIFITIPFQGNRELFYCHPSMSDIVYLDEGTRINTTDVTAKIVLEQLDEKIYFSELTKVLNSLSSNLPLIHKEIQPWNTGLKELIKQLLENRKGVVAKKLDFMEKIGLKINPKSTEYLIPQTIVRKAIPTPVTETNKNIAKEKIITLQQEVYDDIREVLYNVGKAIERKPPIYKEKHEEDLRDIFLLFLETRYESTTGVGEAFNKKGKTDILLKYAEDGTNLFVAECKFWKGKKALIEAINQLLSYLTHRDTKTALIFFITQKDMTNIVSTVKTEITKHTNFSRHIQDTYEHSINYEFTLPDDYERKIQIEVMLFHFPTI